MPPAFFRRLAFAALVFLAVSPVHGQPTSDLFQGFRSSSKDPINIDAKALEISEEDKQRISVFSGELKVRRGDTLLKASTIKLFEDLEERAPKKNQCSRIEAAGRVSVTSGGQVVTGDNAVFTTKANT